MVLIPEFQNIFGKGQKEIAEMRNLDFFHSSQIIAIFHVCRDKSRFSQIFATNPDFQFSAHLKINLRTTFAYSYVSISVLRITLL